MTQPRMDFSRDAFDLQPVPVTDSHVLDPGEQQRLSGQNARILARLEQGPMTRDEIAAIGRNATARISDIRKHLKPTGRTVKCIEQNRLTGFSRYAIVPLEMGE